MVIITATGADKPGIVAAVTGALLELGANLDDTAMSLLGGQFAMMMLVEVDAAPERVLDALQQATDHLSLRVTVDPATAAVAIVGATQHVISVYGADHPGIVHGIAETLAELRVNIRDLSSHLTGDLYTMVLDVDVPADADPAAVEASLRLSATRLGVDFSLRAADADEL